MRILFQWLEKKLFAVNIARSYEDMQLQANGLLTAYGFESSVKYRQLFATYIQHLPPDQDYFIPGHMVSMIRKLEANEAAYYLMNPSMYEKAKAEELKQAESKASEQAAAEEAPTEVVQEAQG